MEGLLWGVGSVLVGVVGVCVYVVLRLKAAESWLVQAKEEAPAKKIASMEAFLNVLRKEFSTVTEQIDEKHDRWLREQASLRTYIHRRIGKEQKPDQPTDGTPDRITAAEAAELGADNGATVTAEGERQNTRRKIKAAYYAARGVPE